MRHALRALSYLAFETRTIIDVASNKFTFHLQSVSLYVNVCLSRLIVTAQGKGKENTGEKGVNKSLPCVTEMKSIARFLSFASTIVTFDVKDIFER